MHLISCGCCYLLWKCLDDLFKVSTINLELGFLAYPKALLCMQGHYMFCEDVKLSSFLISPFVLIAKKKKHLIKIEA